MSDPTQDWLKVIFRPELEARDGATRAAPADRVVARLTPPRIDLSGPPRRERRHRVTVIPAAPGQRWKLYLAAEIPAGADDADAPARGVWWKAEPGTWQPLSGERALVAEGRGRTRLDVAFKLDGEARGPQPDLRLLAEPAG